MKLLNLLRQTLQYYKDGYDQEYFINKVTNLKYIYLLDYYKAKLMS